MCMQRLTGAFQGNPPRPSRGDRLARRLPLLAASLAAAWAAPTASGQSWCLDDHPRLTVGSGPVSVASADLDGDGDRDLVVANNGSNSVSVLLNQGNNARFA